MPITDYNHDTVHVCQGTLQWVLYHTTSCASVDPNHGLIIVRHTAVLVSCSLALTQAVILGHDRGECHKTMNTRWLYVINCWCPSLHLYPGMGLKTAELLLLNSPHTMSDLHVSCLGGPVIDAWDSDWILNPVPDVWQLTPSLQITSFTQATGFLCLGPYHTTFSYWDFCQQCTQFLCFHMYSVAAV